MLFSVWLNSTKRSRYRRPKQWRKWQASQQNVIIWVKTVTSWKHVDFPRGNITFKATQKQGHSERERESDKIWVDNSELRSAAEPHSILHLAVCTFDRPPEIWNMASHHLIERNIIVVRKRNVTYNLFGAAAASAVVVVCRSHVYLHIRVQKTDRVPFVIVAFLFLLLFSLIK